MADLAINHLRRDHQHARKILTELESLLNALDSDVQWTPERQETCDRLTKYFTEDLTSLIRKEDEILYPSLKELFPSDFGPLSVLRSEHQSLCINFRRLCEIGKSLRPGESSPETLRDFEQCGWKAVEVLHDHLYKEDRVLFPMVARFLTPELDAELVGKMENLHTAGNPLDSIKQQA